MAEGRSPRSSTSSAVGSLPDIQRRQERGLRAESGSAMPRVGGETEVASSMPATDELAALIAEQEKDDQWGHRVYQGASLDYEFEEGGSFREVVGYSRAAETNVRKIPRPQKWTKREIIKHIRAWVSEHGETPDYADWNKPNGRGVPSSASLARHFGSFDAAIKAAGFEARGVGGAPKQQSPKKYGRQRIRAIKNGTRLSTEQLAAAYVLYERKGLSTADLGDLLWRKYGYPHPKACAEAIRHGFHAEGFRIRTRSEARKALPDEVRAAWSAAIAGANRKLSDEQVAEIVALRGQMRQVDIAERFGISQSVVSRIHRGAVDYA